MQTVHVQHSNRFERAKQVACALAGAAWLRGGTLYFLLSVVLSLAFSAEPCRAFMDSEDEQFQAEIDEAKARARDFDRTLRKIEAMDQDREAASKYVGRDRDEDARQAENARREFVAERRARPNEDLIRERFEKEDEIEKAKEARQQEANRKEYVAKRDRVRKVIGREAYLDEAREYGL